MFQRALMTRGTLFSWNYSKPRGTSCCFDLFISHWDSLSLKFHAMKLSSPFLSNLLKGCQSGTSPEHRVSRKLSSSFEIFSKNVKEEHPCYIIFCTTKRYLSLFPLKCRIKESRRIFLKISTLPNFFFLIILISNTILLNNYSTILGFSMIKI